MHATEPELYLTEALPDAVPTNVNLSSSALSEPEPDSEGLENWQRLIDHRLIEWGRNPQQLADEGVEAPSAEIVRVAIDWADKSAQLGRPLPDRVVPDGNGGIVFERSENGGFEVFHVWDDRTVEYQRFQGTRLVERILC